MTVLQSKIARMTMLAVCSAALTAPLALFAQDAPPPPAAQNGGGDMMARMQQREAGQIQMMITQLSLTDAQTASVKQIFADRDAKMGAIFSNQSLSQDDRRTQMMTLRNDSNAKIRALLTPEQQTKFDAMPQPRGGGMGGGNRGGGAPPQQ